MKFLSLLITIVITFTIPLHSESKPIENVLTTFVDSLEATITVAPTMPATPKFTQTQQECMQKNLAMLTSSGKLSDFDFLKKLTSYSQKETGDTLLIPLHSYKDPLFTMFNYVGLYHNTILKLLASELDMETIENYEVQTNFDGAERYLFNDDTAQNELTELQQSVLLQYRRALVLCLKDKTLLPIIASKFANAVFESGSFDELQRCRLYLEIAQGAYSMILWL